MRANIGHEIRHGIMTPSLQHMCLVRCAVASFCTGLWAAKDQTQHHVATGYHRARAWISWKLQIHRWLISPCTPMRPTQASRAVATLVGPTHSHAAIQTGVCAISGNSAFTSHCMASTSIRAICCICCSCIAAPTHTHRTSLVTSIRSCPLPCSCPQCQGK